MISKINIKGIATYQDKTQMEPTKINYIYGCNGSGKTTLSNLIRNPNNYPTCSLEWSNGKLETIVYNRDFIRESFSQSSSIKGIFTLGKDTKEAKEHIDNLKQQIDSLNEQIKGYNKTLTNKEEEKNNKTIEITDKFWSVKLKYDEAFKDAFKGFIRTKKHFLNKCISEEKNTAKLLEKDIILEKCKRIFGKSLTKYDEFKGIEYNELSDLETNHILTDKIIGKEDIPIGNLIKKLNNSDWVKQGLEFLNNSNKICPFCQSPINDDLKKNIEDFFDQTYQEKCTELKIFKENYDKYVQNLINKIEIIIDTNIDIIDYEALTKELEVIREKKKANIILINKKIESPSTVIEIDSLLHNFDQAQIIIEGYLKEIQNNNKLIDNIKHERDQLSNEIWKFIYTELENDIKAYNTSIQGIDKAKEAISKSIERGQNDIAKLKKQIELKESEITSTTHTINEINKILTLYGFNNFKLAQSTESGYYKIIRPNGEDVNETLSEGEYTFITFLYFYQLVKGSIEKTGTINDKVIVIDDPISSLDSNVLFIVSNLVKDIIKNCNDEVNGIKQIFVLTHNVYFHKEITFKGSRESNSKKESFWIVRKLNGISSISEYLSNPIQTTYELLWRELHDINKINPATIFNTMRRILEYYFNILGGKKYEECIDKFEGEEKLICKSLIAWINDGSHFIGDDLEMPIDREEIQKYMNVFRLIFDKMNQLDHYNMMMKLE